LKDALDAIQYSERELMDLDVPDDRFIGYITNIAQPDPATLEIQSYLRVKVQEREKSLEQVRSMYHGIQWLFEQVHHYERTGALSGFAKESLLSLVREEMGAWKNAPKTLIDSIHSWTLPSHIGRPSIHF
jgi:hypothetical protein